MGGGDKAASYHSPGPARRVPPPPPSGARHRLRVRGPRGPAAKSPAARMRMPVGGRLVAPAPSLRSLIGDEELRPNRRKRPVAGPDPAAEARKAHPDRDPPADSEPPTPRGPAKATAAHRRPPEGVCSEPVPPRRAVPAAARLTRTLGVVVGDSSLAAPSLATRRPTVRALNSWLTTSTRAAWQRLLSAGPHDHGPTPADRHGTPTQRVHAPPRAGASSSGPGPKIRVSCGPGPKRPDVATPP